MSTIKEVAQVAGVSVGSVSNVINGKTNNQQLIEKVEKVIKELGFRPDAKARSLKIASTFLVGVLVSNIEDARVQLMIAAIEKELRSCGYSIIVKTTDNNAILEKKHIEYFIQQGVDGIIVNTTVKHKKWLELINQSKIPVVFMDKDIELKNNMNVVMIDYREALKDFFDWTKQNQYKSIGFMLENGVMTQQELYYGQSDIVFKEVEDYSIEGGFKAAYELLYEHSDLDILVVSSYMIATGCKKAVEIFQKEQGKKLPIVCIKAENWLEDDNVFEGVINVSYYDIGRVTARKVLEAVEKGGFSGTDITNINATFKEVNKPFYNGKKCTIDPANVIRVAMLDAASANVLQMFSKVYEKETGIHIEFLTMDYHELWHYLIQSIKNKSSTIDVFMYDIIWLEDLVRMGGFEDLTLTLSEHPEYFKDYIEGIINHYGMYEDHLYGLPFMTGTQLLFYQKDLFEDPDLKIQFYRMNEFELSLPKTWDEFNQIAKFFTQEFNINSPVKYGTALINKGNLYNSIEFLNRLWAFHGSVMDNGQITITNEKSVIALESYGNSFQYTNQNKCYDTWGSIANDLKQGNIAMGVLYDSYAFGLNDSTASKMAGNVGSCIIPGECPVLGGWSLAINKNSMMKKAALNFIMWACGRRIANPFAVLSGISSRKSFYDNKELDGLYPWKQNVLASYAKSKKRELLHNVEQPGINIEIYDKIVGQGVMKAITEKQNAKEALEGIKNKIEQYTQK